MDFHSLTRRQLQSLCKKNKIPANMTNVAMADALSSLTTVEGIEDIGKSMPETPLTTRKTTTARKPVKRETDLVETSKGVARPSRAPSTEKSSGSEIIIPSTPATRSCRKKSTGTLVSRKTVCKIEEDGDVGKEVPVVDHGYSTRRSARLQQKSGVKVSEYIQKVGGGRNDAVKIEMLSEEENDGDTKSEITSEVQQKNDVVKIEVGSVEEEQIESMPKVTSDVHQESDSVKIEMLSDEEMKSQSEVTIEAQQKHEGYKAEVTEVKSESLEHSNVDEGTEVCISGVASAPVVYVEESMDLVDVLCKSSFIEGNIDNPKDKNEESLNQSIEINEVEIGVTHALEFKCTDENIEVKFTGVEAIYADGSSPMVEITANLGNINEAVEVKAASDLDNEPRDIIFTEVEDINADLSSPVAENTENLEDSFVVVDVKATSDLHLNCGDEDELGDIKVTEVEAIYPNESSQMVEKTESLEDSNVDEGNCKLTSEVELYKVKGTEIRTSGVASVSIVYVKEPMDIADVLCKSSPMEGDTENPKDKNEDENMKSENHFAEVNEVEIGVTHALEVKCTDEAENIDGKVSETEAIYTDGSSPMVEITKNLGNTDEVVEVKAAPDFDNEPRDVKFTEVEDIYADVSSSVVVNTENLENSSVVVEVKADSDLNLNYIVEDELGDTKETEVEAIYPYESSPMVEETENLEDPSLVAEGNAALDLDLKFVDEDKLSDVNVTDAEGIYVDESSLMAEKIENLDDSNVVVDIKATPDLELKLVDESELSDVKVSEAEATYADESSPLVVKTENLENSIVDEGKRTSEASKAEELSLSSSAFDFECIKGSSKEVMSCLKAELCNLEAQQEDTVLVLTEVEGAISDGSEVHMVGLEKSDLLSDDLEIAAILDDEVNWSSDDETSSYESEEDFSTEAPNSDIMEEMVDNKFDIEEEIPAAVEENEGCSDVDISKAIEELSISPSVNDPNVNDTAMPVVTPTKTTASENVVRGTTPLKSSTKKKASTTLKPFMIFNESKELDESGKLDVSSTSKVAKELVPEKKENNGENTAQRKLKATSVRQLKKMIKQLTLKDNKNIIVKEQLLVGKKPALQHSKNTPVKEFQVGKRAALQQLSNNCLAAEKQK